MRKDGKTGTPVRAGGLLSAAVQVALIALAVGAIAGYAVIPGVRDAVNGVIGSVTEIFMPAADPVSTSGTATGPGTSGHPAQRAFDGTTAYWAAPFEDGAPPTIAAVFDPPADITKILVTSGAPDDEFKELARPRDVVLELLDAGGTVIASKDIELKDQAEAQAFDVGAKGASSVRVTVRSVYLAESPAAPVAITEVEFFGRRTDANATPVP